MKKLLKKLCVFIAPFLAIVLLLFVFEPYDYLCLRGDAAYLTKPLSSMREVMVEQPANIILGDSKMANLNMDYVKELTGEDYTMLGFGGANLGELVELFWFATEHTTLQKVVFGISFYTAGGSFGPGRIPAMAQQATNIFRFMGSFPNWLEALDNAQRKAVNLAGNLLDRPDWLRYPEDPTGFDAQPASTEMGDRYRKDLEIYATDQIYNNCKNYKLDEATLTALQDVIDYCDAQGIELTFVFAPTHESIYTLVTEPLGIDGVTPALKQFLIGKARVLDMEFLNGFTRNDANFMDGFHLTGPNKKWLAEMIFTTTPSDYIVRYEKSA